RHTRSYGDWSSDVCSSDLAAGVTAETLRPLVAAPTGARVCVPAVGGGSFLIAAARQLAAAGAPLTDVVGACLFGADVDPMAVARSEEHTSELQSPYDLVCR